MCLFRKAEESSGQPVPVPRGKKRSSGSPLDDGKSEVTGFQPVSEATVTGDGVATSDVCQNCPKYDNIY